MKKIDKLTKHPIKDAFRYEDRDLTPWLTENIDVISEAIGVTLTNAEKEQSTGSFSVDIKAETEDGRSVVIENQFGKSNHDHLGKLITYLTAFEAKMAIWIVEDARPEHINAISWLNESDNQCDFFLLKIEAVTIGESKIAPLLTSIIAPSEESKAIGRVKKEDSKRDASRKSLWEQVLNLSKQKGLLQFESISPSKDSWIGATAGRKGLTYQYWINQHSYRIELRIDLGKEMDNENLRLFNQLAQHKEEINETFGSALNWEALEGYRSCSIRYDSDEFGGYKSNEDFRALSSDMVTKMTYLIQATAKWVVKLK